MPDPSAVCLSRFGSNALIEELRQRGDLGLTVDPPTVADEIEDDAFAPRRWVRTNDPLAAASMFRPKIGGWHVGWKGKVWIGIGEWFRFEVGNVGGLWCFVGAVTLAIRHTRDVQDDGRITHALRAAIYWRWGRG